MLGPSIDQRDELEDELTVVGGISFIASEEFLSQYGEKFEVCLEEGRLVVNQI